jgi:hypothetical protein
MACRPIERIAEGARDDLDLAATVSDLRIALAEVGSVRFWVFSRIRAAPVQSDLLQLALSETSRSDELAEFEWIDLTTPSRI